MKLTFTQKQIDQAPKGYTRVQIVEDGQSRFVVEDGIETLEIGSKKWSEVNQRKFIVLCRSIVASAKQNKRTKIAVQLSNSPFPQMKGVPLPELGSIIAQAFEMANYEHTSYKTKPKNGWDTVEEILICGETPKDMQAGFARGQTIAKEVNTCRELCNTPGGDMTPKTLAKAAKAAILGTTATVKVLGEKEMQKLGMGAILGMARGSAEEPQFIIMEYKGGPASQKPLVLIGKGVTFDTGGLNIKPGDHMYEMHMDMSGGAAVIHAVALAAKLKLKTNFVGLVPAIENAPASGAVRPGDILKSLSGKTIEVVNTDAEGRVILADAITYAKRYAPSAVVDVATLTGASLVALGTQASGFMTNEQKLTIDDHMRLAEESGDYMWPLPMWDEYEDMVKGGFADIPNIPTTGNSRYGGVIAGGMFLWQFAKELGCHFTHIDMAPRMTSAQGEHLAKGAAGAPVRFLLKLIEKEVK
jgi:leucyl aminopeptidase